MFWTWNYNNKKFISWGKPRSISGFENLSPCYDIQIYDGKIIKPEEKVLYSMQGDSTLGMGDSIWLINYIRDIYRIKGNRRCNMHIASSNFINKFYSHFLPKTMTFREEYIPFDEIQSFSHILPAMYYWKEKEADKSWVDNKSILERLYDNVGLEYYGLSDFGEFTNEKILYPSDDFYTKLKINKNDKYIFFQWHSSGHCKNLPPKTNIKIIKHLIDKYKLKVYVIGKVDYLDKLENIKGVVNLSGKTLAEDVFTLAFNAEFIVCPDSAGVHLGEAYRIPTVGIMATLPPVYIASKYKIPTFMYGSGFCQYKPCGVVDKLPVDRCPKDTTNYCAVLEDIDLNLFDKCLLQTIYNKQKLGSKPATNFYDCQFLPITMN